MGCDYSKEVKKEFDSKVKEIKIKIENINKRKSQLEELLRDMITSKEPSITEADIKSELTRRMDRLEEMIQEIRELDRLGNSDTFTPSNLRSFASNKLEESARIARKEDSLVREQSVHSDGREDIIETDRKETLAQRKNKAAFNSAAIIDDPSIKAIIDKKRKMLESNSKPPSVAVSFDASSILNDPSIRAIIEKKKRMLQGFGNPSSYAAKTDMGQNNSSENRL